MRSKDMSRLVRKLSFVVLFLYATAANVSRFDPAVMPSLSAGGLIAMAGEHDLRQLGRCSAL
jgi:hypothetical protein